MFTSLLAIRNRLCCETFTVENTHLLLNVLMRLSQTKLRSVPLLENEQKFRFHVKI